MNLGGLFSSFGGVNNSSRITSKTILVILVVIIVIFGFGYGRGMFSGLGGSYAAGYRGRYGGYGDFTEYRYIDPPDRKRKSKHRHKKRNYDQDDVITYRSRYGYMNPGFEYGGFNMSPGYAGPGYPGYAGATSSGIFGNDWFFIIAVIAILFLLGEDVATSDENTNDSNIGNICC